MNKAALLRSQAQQLWPGATVQTRGRKDILHLHPDDPDRFMLDTSIGPIHFGINEDQEIDTAWQQTGGGAFQYEMTLNDFQTFARDTFNAGDIFRFEKGGDWVQFDPQSINWIDENISRQQIAIKQAVLATADDDRLTFADAYGSGIHFEYQNQSGRLQKLITIDNLSDLPAVTLQGNDIWFEAEFSLSHGTGMEIYLDNVLWEKTNGVRVQSANRIEFRDATDGVTVRWSLDFPRATDSSIDGNETIGEIEVRRQGGPASLFITVRIPKTWLDTATFPVFIDPTIDPIVGASSDDAQEQGNGTMSLTVGTPRLGSGGIILFGHRFTLTGPASTDTIDVAYQTTNQDQDFADEIDDVDIWADDVDDSPTFTTTNSDISDRTPTTAVVTWNPGTPDIGTGDVNGPSIVTVIQEIIDRGSWASGNGFGLIMGLTPATSGTDWRIRHYDNSTTLCPRLHIEYTAAAAGGNPWYAYAQQ